jgi:dipeptidyl aminopeptidase/acylaminoacyl peptidase
LPLSFSPDDQLMTFIRADPKTLRDIWVLSLKDHKRTSFLATPATEGAPRFSPDGRWLAYVSDESGRPEVYVQPYPGPGGKWQIFERRWDRACLESDRPRAVLSKRRQNDGRAGDVTAIFLRRPTHDAV